MRAMERKWDMVKKHQATKPCQVTRFTYPHTSQWNPPETLDEFMEQRALKSILKKPIPASEYTEETFTRELLLRLASLPSYERKIVEEKLLEADTGCSYTNLMCDLGLAMILPHRLKEYLDNFDTPYNVSDLALAFAPFVKKPGKVFELSRWPFGDLDLKDLNSWHQDLETRAKAHLGKDTATTREFLSCLLDLKTPYGVHLAVVNHVERVKQQTAEAETAKVNPRATVKGLTPTQAAERAGVTTSAISHAMHSNKKRLKFTESGKKKLIDPESLQELYPQARNGDKYDPFA